MWPWINHFRSSASPPHYSVSSDDWVTEIQRNFTIKDSLSNSIYIKQQAQLFLFIYDDVVRKTKNYFPCYQTKTPVRTKNIISRHLRCRRSESFRYLLVALDITSICKSLDNNIKQTWVSCVFLLLIYVSIFTLMCAYYICNSAGNISDFCDNKQNGLQIWPIS